MTNVPGQWPNNQPAPLPQPGQPPADPPQPAAEEKPVQDDPVEGDVS